MHKHAPGAATGSEDDRPSYFDFNLPAKIEFGPGALRRLPGILSLHRLRRVVLVVTPGRRRSGMLDETLRDLDERGIQARIFDRVRENPDLATVADCVRFLGRARPEALIALGGGSTIDTAKAAGVCYANAFEDPRRLHDLSEPVPTLPAIMVPTTAGSGSEANYWAVITDSEHQEKLSIGHPAMAPFLAVVDPQLLVTLPPHVTLSTGLDAFTHAVESYFSVAGNSLSAYLSLGAVTLLLRSLEKAVDCGEDIEARGETALASLVAGISMANVGLGLVHAMSHQVGGFYDSPHGLTNALLLPHVLALNAASCPEKAAGLDRAVGSSARRHHGDSRRTLLSWIEDLYAQRGIAPNRISIRARDIPELSARAMENVNVRTNPASVDAEAIAEVYRRSFLVDGTSH